MLLTCPSNNFPPKKKEYHVVDLLSEGYPSKTKRENKKEIKKVVLIKTRVKSNPLLWYHVSEKEDLSKEKSMREKLLFLYFSPHPIHFIYIWENLQNITKNIVMVTFGRKTSTVVFSIEGCISLFFKEYPKSNITFPDL